MLSSSNSLLLLLGSAPWSPLDESSLRFHVDLSQRTLVSGGVDSWTDQSPSATHATTVARGYSCASAAVFADDTMLLCQRWPINGLGGQGCAFYSLRRESNGLVRVSPPAFLDPLCPIDGTRRQMYGDGVALDASRAIYVWAHDDGTYTGEATVYEAEVNKG